MLSLAGRSLQRGLIGRKRANAVCRGYNLTVIKARSYLRNDALDK